MKTAKIGDFLTHEQVQRCADLYPDRVKIRDEVIRPNMAAINRKLGQENDPDYLSFAVVHAIQESQRRGLN